MWSSVAQNYDIVKHIFDETSSEAINCSVRSVFDSLHVFRRVLDKLLIAPTIDINPIYMYALKLSFVYNVAFLRLAPEASQPFCPVSI